MEEAKVVERTAFELLNYGVLGIMAILLIAALILIWRRMEAKDKMYLARIDEFIEVTKSYAINEVAQTEVMKDLKGLIIKVLEK